MATKINVKFGAEGHGNDLTLAELMSLGRLYKYELKGGVRALNEGVQAAYTVDQLDDDEPIKLETAADVLAALEESEERRYTVVGFEIEDENAPFFWTAWIYG